MFDDETKPVWWLPSFGFFLFAGIVLWMFFVPSRLFEDPGVGRHLRTAQFILENGSVPRTDPLSFTHHGERWMDFEWGFEATIGVLTRVGGLGLVAAFCAALFGATLLGLYRTLLHSSLGLVPSVIYTGLAFLTLQLHFEARPVLFTYLFMALVVEVWHRRTQPLKRDWIILPIVFIAWANLHAGWLAALVFLGAAMVGRFFDRLSGRVDGLEAPLIPWLGLTLLCTVATSFNPWGWALHRQIFLFATSYKSFALWDEYLPPNFAGPSMSAVTVLALLAIIIGARVSRRALAWRWETFLPVFFFLYQGLKAQRHVLLLVEVAAVPVARDLGTLLYGTWLPFVVERLRQFQARQRLAGGDAWLALVFALGMAFLFMRPGVAQHIQVGGTSPDLITFLREHPDRFHRPLTTTWNAGPLLWNLAPDFRVSFDDRGDFYGDETVFAFNDLTRATPGWREKFASGRYDSAILDSYLPLVERLPELPGWKEVFRDKATVVFWKD
jgi:hypothetical protein